jgi:hypothetical protein
MADEWLRIVYLTGQFVHEGVPGATVLAVRRD